MTITAIVKALVTAGASPEQIAAAVEAAESASIAADEERRRKAREKKREQRVSRGQKGTNGDSGGQTGTPPKRKAPPHPPKENNPPACSEAKASSQAVRGANALDDLEAKLREAAGLEQSPSTGLLDLSPVVKLLDQGYDLAVDILPKLRAAKASGKRPGSWSYFVPMVTEGKARNDAIPPKAQAPPVPAQAWVTDDDPRLPDLAARWEREHGRKPRIAGSKNQRGVGAYFPLDWLAQH